MTPTQNTGFMKPRIGITLELSEKRGKRTSFLDLAYAECVKGAGGIPMHFPPLPSAEFIAGIIPLIDGLVLTGGADLNSSYYRGFARSVTTLPHPTPKIPRNVDSRRTWQRKTIANPKRRIGYFVGRKAMV